MNYQEVKSPFRWRREIGNWNTALKRAWVRPLWTSSPKTTLGAKPVTMLTTTTTMTMIRIGNSWKTRLRFPVWRQRDSAPTCPNIARIIPPWTIYWRRMALAEDSVVNPSMSWNDRPLPLCAIEEAATSKMMMKRTMMMISRFDPWTEGVAGPRQPWLPIFSFEMIYFRLGI